METKQKLPDLKKFEALIKNEREVLLLEQDKVIEILLCPHSFEETKQLKKAVLKSNLEINGILFPLLQVESASTCEEYKKEAQKLYSQCRALKEEIRITDKLIDDDLAYFAFIKKQQEKADIARTKAAIDLTKTATFYIVTVGACVTAVKNGLGDGLVSLNQAILAGLALCTGVTFHKPITAGLKKTAKAICEIPKKIKERPTDYGVPKGLNLLELRP